MKTPLSFYFIAAVAGALACSDEGGNERGAAGNGGQQVATAGSAGQGGGSNEGVGGSGGAGGNGSGGAPGGPNLGAVLSITGSGAEVVVEDTMGNTGIIGGIILAQSMVMTTEAEITSHEGQLCMKGTTAVVPDGNSYGTHWGAELSLDLKRAPNPDAAAGDAGAGDAGAGDAGGGEVLGTEAVPWPVGNVIGFSYKISGMDPAITLGQGVSPGAFRFKAVPEGANTEIDTYCSTRSPTHNGTENVLLSDIRFECWNPMTASLADDPIAYNVGSQGMPSTRPNPRALMSLSWQIPADLNIAHQFDFCISELRPILAP